MTDKPTWKAAQFVQVTLTNDDLEAMKTWIKARSDVSEFMQRIIEEGHKLSFNYDRKNHWFVCWAIPTSETDPNNGLILSGRGKNPANALGQVLWLHYEKYAEKWPGAKDNGSARLWDDE
jgi:hypothetical protein